METFQFDIAEPKEKKPDCKGLFFRGYRNLYHAGSEVHLKEGFKLLKRKSCSGCEQCDHFSDYMSEMIEGAVIIPEIKHGALYTLIVSNISTDWETGHADDWDYEFVEVEES